MDWFCDNCNKGKKNRRSQRLVPKESKNCDQVQENIGDVEEKLEEEKENSKEQEESKEENNEEKGKKGNVEQQQGTGGEGEAEGSEQKHLTTLEAAILVLKEARKPLSVSEITARALKLGWVTKSKTPENTMTATLSQKSIFRRPEPRMYEYIKK